MGRRAAVKAVSVEPGPDGRSLCADLQREIKLLKGCNSELIVRYYGCLQKARTLWIAMELCDGSVADVLRVTAAPLVRRAATFFFPFPSHTRAADPTARPRRSPRTSSR